MYTEVVEKIFLTEGETQILATAEELLTDISVLADTQELKNLIDDTLHCFDDLGDFIKVVE